MSKTIKTTQGGKADKPEIIDLTKKVTVTATDKAPHHEKGEKISVHPKLAKIFIERGYATGKVEDEPVETDENEGGEE